MKVSAQYVVEHISELLDSVEPGEEIEISREGKSPAKLTVLPIAEAPRHKEMILGAGRGEIVLPTDEEWKAMDRELEDLMVNGPIFPPEPK